MNLDNVIGDLGLYDQENYKMNTAQLFANEHTYSFLLLYFLEDLSSPPYYDEIMNSPDPKETICKYLEQWIPWEDGLVQLLKGLRANQTSGKMFSR